MYITEGAPIEVLARWRLEKMTAEREVFEILEGGDGLVTQIVMTIPGLAPPESYFKKEDG